MTETRLVAMTELEPITIASFQVEPSACAQCGMALRHPREYHPFVACILMEHYRNGNDVRTALEGVFDYFQRGGALDDISSARWPTPASLRAKEAR